MSHKGVGVIAKTTVPAITELVREYVKAEGEWRVREFEGGEKASLTEKRWRLRRQRAAFCEKKKRKTEGINFLKQAKAKNGDNNNNISSKAKEGELEDEDEYSISSETWRE